METQLQANKPELYQWLAFTLQKIQELRVIKTALEQGRAAVQADLDASQVAADARKNSREIHRTCVAERLANLPKNADQRKSPFAERIKLQNAWLNLPLLPTTNIVPSRKPRKFVMPVPPSKKAISAWRITKRQWKKKLNLWYVNKKNWI